MNGAVFGPGSNTPGTTSTSTNNAHAPVRLQRPTTALPSSITPNMAALNLNSGSFASTYYSNTHQNLQNNTALVNTPTAPTTPNMSTTAQVHSFGVTSSVSSKPILQRPKTASLYHSHQQSNINQVHTFSKHAPLPPLSRTASPNHSSSRPAVHSPYHSTSSANPMQRQQQQQQLNVYPQQYQQQRPVTTISNAKTLFGSSIERMQIIHTLRTAISNIAQQALEMEHQLQSQQQNYSSRQFTSSLSSPPRSRALERKWSNIVESVMERARQNARFEKQTFVQQIYSRLKESLGPLMTRILQDFSHNRNPDDLVASIPGIVDRITTSKEYLVLLDSILAEIDTNVPHLVHDIPYSHHVVQPFTDDDDNDDSDEDNDSESGIEADASLRRTAGAHSRTFSNFSMISNITNASNATTPSLALTGLPGLEEMEQWIHMLTTATTVDARREALRALSTYPASDLASEDIWQRCQSGFEACLVDPFEPSLGKSTLKLYARIFKTAPTNIVVDVYTSLVKTFTKALESDNGLGYYLDSVEYEESGYIVIKHPQIDVILRAARLIHRFQHSFATTWYRIPEVFSKDLFTVTIPKYFRFAEVDGTERLSFLHFVALSDPNASWFRYWMMREWGRARAINVLQEMSNEKYDCGIKGLVRRVLSFFATWSFDTVSNDGSVNTNDRYGISDIEYYHFTQCLQYLMVLLGCTRVRRVLFPLSGLSLSETVLRGLEKRFGVSTEDIGSFESLVSLIIKAGFRVVPHWNVAGIKTSTNRRTRLSQIIAFDLCEWIRADQKWLRDSLFPVLFETIIDVLRDVKFNDDVLVDIASVLDQIVEDSVTGMAMLLSEDQTAIGYRVRTFVLEFVETNIASLTPGVKALLNVIASLCKSEEGCRLYGISSNLQYRVFEFAQQDEMWAMEWLCKFCSTSTGVNACSTEIAKSVADYIIAKKLPTITNLPERHRYETILSTVVSNSIPACTHTYSLDFYNQVIINDILLFLESDESFDTDSEVLKTSMSRLQRFIPNSQTVKAVLELDKAQNGSETIITLTDFIRGFALPDPKTDATIRDECHLVGLKVLRYLVSVDCEVVKSMFSDVVGRLQSIESAWTHTESDVKDVILDEPGMLRREILDKLLLA